MTRGHEPESADEKKETDNTAQFHNIRYQVGKVKKRKRGRVNSASFSKNINKY